MKQCNNPAVMKRLLIILLFVFPFNELLAQSGYEDVVYLKNGSVYRGVIIEQVPGVSLKIEMADRNVFSVKMEEVARMTKEEVPNKKKIKATNENYKKKGYIKIFEFYQMFTLEDQADYETYEYHDSDVRYGLGAEMINGYQFNAHLSAGLGLGLNIYYQKTLLPAYADLRVNFLKKKSSPFGVLQIGYAFDSDELPGAGTGNNEFDGGFLLNPSIGFRFFVRPKRAYIFSLGYRYQEFVDLNRSYGYNPTTNPVNKHVDGVIFRFGFGF